MNDCDEDRSVYNGHLELEVLIDRPVAQVWKQYLDIGSWVTSHDIESVCGAADAVGSITRVSFRQARDLGWPVPHYHYCKIIKLVPQRQYVVKSYMEKGGSYGMQGIAFDDTRFVEIEGKTKVVFNLFAEMRSDAIARDPAAVNLDGSRRSMSSNLNNLKRILENTGSNS